VGAEEAEWIIEPDTSDDGEDEEDEEDGGEEVEAAAPTLQGYLAQHCPVEHDPLYRGTLLIRNRPPP